MSVETVNAFIEKLNSDETFRNQITEADSNEARLHLAQEAGIELSAKEFDSIVEQFSGDELSDDELESVAGGVISGVFKFAKNKWKVEEGESYVDKHSPDLLQ